MSLRDTLVTYIYATFGLTSKVLYVCQKNGSDANNGLTEGTAVATIAYAISSAHTGGDGYIIYVLGGEYYEGSLGLLGNAIIGRHNAKIIDNSTYTILTSVSYPSTAGAVVGLQVTNTVGNAISKGGSYSASDCIIIDSIIEGNCTFGRGYFTFVADTEFRNGVFSYSTNGTTNLQAWSAIENITFDNCENILLLSTSGGRQQNTNKIIAKDSTFTFEYNNDVADDIFDSIFDNCQFRFSNNEVWGSVVSSYALAVSISELIAKRDLDLSITSAPDMYSSCKFQDADFLDDANGNFFQSGRDNYINNRHVGMRRYAIYIDSTQITAPVNGSVASGYAESTVAPATGIEFICDAIEFDSAKVIKRISVIADIGSGGEILSSQVEDVNQRIIDVDMCFSAIKTASELDAAPESYSAYEIGIIDTSLNYDNVDEVAKSCKLKFTLKNEGVSTDFGEVKVYQIIVETEDIHTFENYTDYELKQYGNFHLRKEYDTNLWVGANDINLNPKGEATTQAVLDTYSGSAGKVTFTDQELYALVTAAGGDILLVYAETLDAVLAVDIIADGNQNTNLAQVTTSAGIPIWSYNLI